MAYNNYMFPQGYQPAILPQYQQTIPQIQQNAPQQQVQPRSTESVSAFDGQRAERILY